MLKKGEIDKAIPLYKKAINISPTFKVAFLNLTAVYFNQNQIDSALDLLKSYKGSASDENYKYFLLTVIKAKINYIKKIYNDKLIISVIEKILLNEEWILIIFEKSLEKNINFENQLLKDVIYTLENIEKKINFMQKEQYYKRYKL